MGKIVKINIASDFSKFPSGRNPEHGDFNGEVFREKFLVPNLQNSEVTELHIDLGGILMRGSSFFEEAFGGLIRVNNIPLSLIKEKLKIEYNKRASFIKNIWEYIEKAEKQRK